MEKSCRLGAQIATVDLIRNKWLLCRVLSHTVASERICYERNVSRSAFPLAGVQDGRTPAHDTTAVYLHCHCEVLRPCLQLCRLVMSFGAALWQLEEAEQAAAVVAAEEDRRRALVQRTAQKAARLQLRCARRRPRPGYHDVDCPTCTPCCALGAGRQVLENCCEQCGWAQAAPTDGHGHLCALAILAAQNWRAYVDMLHSQRHELDRLVCNSLL